MSKKLEQIPQRLLDHLSGSANPDTYKKYFLARNCSEIRRLLVKELASKIDRSVEKCDGSDKFALPAWSEYQAHGAGYRTALREILDLIDR